MKSVTLRVALGTALAGFCVLPGLTPAIASPVTWDFIDPVSNPGPGLVTTTENFTDTTSTYSITAYGITSPAAGHAGNYLPNTTPGHSAPVVGSTVTTSAIPTLTAMYVKNGGTGENGLGLAYDPTGDHEISLYRMIEIATNPNVALYNFQMNSSTNGEGWDVYGSNSNAALGSATLTLLYSDGQDESLHALTAYNYYYFTYDGAGVHSGQGDNVLLRLITGQTITISTQNSSTPLPAALPLFASGLGALGLLGWRRKRKNTAAAAA